MSLSNFTQQFTQFLVLLVALNVLDAGAGFWVAFAAFAFGRIGSFIPLTPGGLGTVDALLIGFLVSGGVENEVAVAATLVWRALTYLPQLIIGLVTFLGWRVKSSKTRAA